MWQRILERQYDELIDYLDDNSPDVCPLYGNILSSRLKYNPMAMRSGYVYGYYRGDDLSAVVAVFNDGNAMIHVTDEKLTGNVVEIIRRGYYHSVWGLGGYLPPMRQLEEYSNYKFEERNLVMMEKIAPTPKACGDDSLEIIRIDRRMRIGSYMPFIKRCMWEGFGFKSGSWDIKKRMKERTAHEPYFVLSAGGKLVSQAHIQAMTPKYGYIGGVCTLREERRKGYAKATVYEVCRYIEGLGRIPALAVSSENRAALNLYESMGFELAGKMKVYMQKREFSGDENQ